MSDRRLGLWLLALLVIGRVAGAMEVALLPPVGDEAVAAAIRSTAAEVGVTVSVLEPAQLIDPARFSPSIYSVAVLVGGEHYPDTVIEEGDTAAAIRRYVDEGGALLVAGKGLVMSRPQRWNGSEWRTISAPLRRLELTRGLGLLDAGQALEMTLPTGSGFIVNPDSTLAGRLPERLPMPAGAETYRPIPQNQDQAITFTPVATLVGDQGSTYGAGAAQMRRAEATGEVFYVWAPLLTGERGGDLLLGMLASHSAVSLTADQVTRRDELLRELDDLERRHRQAAAVLPADLHTAELDALRETVGNQAETLRWLREAAQVGNLSFVALRLQSLRDELSDLPAKVGTALDRAVTEAVANPGGERTPLPLDPPVATPGAQPGENEPVAMGGDPSVSPTPGEAGPREVAEPAPSPREEPRPAPVTTAGETRPPAEAPIPDGGNPEPVDIASLPAAPGTPPDAERTPAAQPQPDQPQPDQPQPDQPQPQPDQPQPDQPQPDQPQPDQPQPQPDQPQPDQPQPQPDQPQPDQPQPQPDQPKRFETDRPVIEFVVKNRGSIYIELFPQEAPKTASAFLYLTRDGFYDNTYFHRRFKRFVVQGGDPFTKTLPPDDPRVGTGGPEFNVPGEFSDTLKHERGTVGLARVPQEPDSGGSQFYICLEAQPSLDGDYAIFGRVIEGMDIVEEIQVGDRVEDARVIQGAEPLNPAGAEPMGLFR